MHTLSIKQLGEALRARKFSSRELTQHYLKRIEAFDPQLNSYITVTADLALAAADAADARLARGEGGPLTGIPLGQKDIFCTTGVRTSCASRMLDKFVSPYDATIVKKLQAEAGMPMLGKLNMDEFAMGSSNETSWYGPVKNPWDVTRVPGGSSGGSVAAVAAGLAPVATATDTGGSIRQPAAVDRHHRHQAHLRPRVALRHDRLRLQPGPGRRGGPLGRGLPPRCCRPCRASTGRWIPPAWCRPDLDDLVAPLGRSIQGLRIGLPKEYFAEGLDAGVRACIDGAIAELKKLGATWSPRSRCRALAAVGPDLLHHRPGRGQLQPGPLRRRALRPPRRGRHRPGGPVQAAAAPKASAPRCKRRIMIGTYVLSHGYYDAYYLQAQKVRRLIYDDFRRVFEHVDVILGPTATDVAFKLGSKTDDPVSMYLNDIYTIAANLAGIPAMSLPCGFKDGLPVGLQLMGNFFDEAKLLNVAHQYQQVTGFHLAPLCSMQSSP